MGIEEKITALRRDVTDAQRRHAGATAGAGQAKARADAVREDLQAEFSITTVDQARQQIAGLERQLDAEAAEVRRQLDLAGGAQ